MDAAVLSGWGEMRNKLAGIPRVGVTELARSKDWRSKLAEKGFAEVTERSETVGYLVTPENMEDLVAIMSSYEEELERIQADLLFFARADMQDWRRGKDLADAAKASFSERFLNAGE